MRAPFELDLHVPNFNYPDVAPDALFEKLVEIATAAEASGFSSISLMDHLHQIGPVGPPEHYMFEGHSMLAALAADEDDQPRPARRRGDLPQPGARR